MRMVGRRKNSYGDAVKEGNSMVPEDQDSGSSLFVITT